MHIDYNLKKILRPSRINAELAKLGNIDKAKATSHLNDQMERLKSEQQKVSDAMIKFAAYLKKNAIFEYNNAFEEKLKMEIRNEEVLVQNGRDRTTLDRLHVILDDYIEQKKKMEAIYKASDGKNVIDSNEVKNIQTKLFKLPLYGEKIKELYNKNTTSNVTRTHQNNLRTDFVMTRNPF
uniref:Uncharacterized protein n=1 Tax=Panagrolaimus sp. JU765 TaxID=591449 RepID=A0AC34RMZ7_9BILA